MSEREELRRTETYNGVFSQRRTATSSRLFKVLGSGFPQTLEQVVFDEKKKTIVILTF